MSTAAAAWRTQMPEGTGVQPLPLALAPSSRLAFRALLVFTFVMLLAPQMMVPALSKLRPAFLAAAIAIGSYLLHRLLRREPLVRLSPELALSAALLWWTLLTLPLSSWLGGSVELLLGLYLKTLLIFWLLCHVVDTPGRLRSVAGWLTAMAVPLAVTGIKQFLAGEFLATGEQRIEGYEAALTNNPNDLALMLNLLLPVAVALMLTARRRTTRVMLAVVVLLEIAGVVFTFSRSGFVTLGVIALLQLYRLARGGRARYAAAMVALALAIVPALPSGYLDRLSTIVHTDEDQTGSAQARWSDMGTAVDYIVENPIVGAGLGMDILALNQMRGSHWTQVHDVYLQYGVDLGLPGLVFYVLLLVSAIVSAWKAREAALAKGRGDVAALADAVWISLIAFAVAAVFYPVGYHFYFYYFAGLAVASRYVCERVLQPRPLVVAPGARAA